VQLSLLPTAKALNNLLRVRFHQGTVEIIARVALLGNNSVPPGESAFAQLRLDSPVLCVHGDRFIIRQFSPAVTIGGGVILNPHPTKHKGSDLTAISSLRALAKGSTAEKISVLVETAPGQVMHFAEIVAIFGIQPAELRRSCDEIVAGGHLIRIAATGDLISAANFRELEKQALSCLGEYHKNNPLQRGMSREELRDRVFRDLPYEVFKFSVERLVQTQRVSVQEESVSLRTHRIEFSAEAQKVRDRIEALLGGAHFQPPLLSEIEASLDLDPQEVRRVLAWMLKEKVLVRIGDDLAYPRLTLEEIKAGIRAGLPAGTKFGVADFKELFHLTRKHAIPLLEYLDRERFTRRQGNDRVLI
jgi:selenocysteine-specific elongation factor